MTRGNIWAAFHYEKDLRDFEVRKIDAQLVLLLDRSFDLLGSWVNLSGKKNIIPNTLWTRLEHHESIALCLCRAGLWRETWIDGVGLKGKEGLFQWLMFGGS